MGGCGIGWGRVGSVWVRGRLGVGLGVVGCGIGWAGGWEYICTICTVTGKI